MEEKSGSGAQGFDIEYRQHRCRLDSQATARFKCTQRVGELKARLGLPPSNPARERLQIARRRDLAAETRLDPQFAEKFLGFIIIEVIQNHLVAARQVADHAVIRGRRDL
jgi:chorismate mutase